MGYNRRNVAVAAFPDRSQAEYAVEELARAGFTPNQIGFALLSDESADIHTFDPPRTRAVDGAGIGLVVGGLAGATLAGVVLPVAGVVVAGGVLAALFGGIAGGGILGALIGLSVPEEEARHIERDFHSGHTLVTVHTDDRYEEAATILERAKAWEPVIPHHGRGRLEGLATGPSGTDGSGRTFVPQP